MSGSDLAKLTKLIEVIPSNDVEMINFYKSKRDELVSEINRDLTSLNMKPLTLDQMLRLIKHQNVKTLMNTEFKFCGFKNPEGEPHKVDSLGRQYGWWEYKNGYEGGQLNIDIITLELVDFDGDFDLPDYVKKELTAAGVEIDF